MKIIVTGSLGHIGKPLTEQLIKEGHAVTVISSKQERAQEIEVLGATAAIGSVEDADFLTAIFSGADAAFTMAPPNFAETDQTEYHIRIDQSYKKAIEQSDIKRVVNISSYGAHLDKGTGFILGAHYSEKILNELSDVAITHLRAGYFYYNLFGFKDMIKEQGIIGANYGGDDKIILVSPKDIAAVAAEELQKSDSKNVRYVVSDVHTANEVAQIIGAAIGKPGLPWLTFTNERMKEGMEKRGMPAHLISNFVELGAGLHSGALLEDYERQAPIPLGEVKLEDFAKEFAAAF